MAQSTDFVLDNQTPAALRAELNQILQAIVTGNSGPTAPTTTYPGMRWEDTSTSPSTMRRRNLANSAWIVDGSGETANRGYIAAANPTMTGTVTVPTPVTTSNTTVAASTQFVVNRIQTHGSWIAATTLNGWSGSLFYRINNNSTVSLRGVATKANSTTSDVIMNLPIGARPTLSDVNDYNSVIGATVATRTTVGLDGNVTLNASASITSTVISLDRITFPLA